MNRCSVAKRSFYLPGLVLIASLAGCGLSDYEDAIRSQKNRVNAIALENSKLGEPLDIPQSVVEDMGIPALLQFQSFIRPPKRFQCESGARLVSRTKSLQLFAYDCNSGCKVFLAAWSEPTKPEAEFAFEVWTAFRAYLDKKLRIPPHLVPIDMPKLKPEDRTPLQFKKEVPQPVKFETFTWSQPEVTSFLGDPKANTDKDLPKYFFNFLRYTSIQAVVIYQVPKSRLDDPDLEQAMDLSRQSFTFQGDGEYRRQLYQRWKGKA